MSDTAQALVYRIGEIRPHPNADRLELTDIAGYQMVVGKGEYKTGDLAVFIQPDSVVPQTEPFKFIWGQAAAEANGLPGVPTEQAFDGKWEYGIPVSDRARRIKPRKLRKEWSEGLLMPVSAVLPVNCRATGWDYPEGFDAASLIGITRYKTEGDEEGPAVKNAAPRRRFPRTVKGWVRFLVYGLLKRLGLRSAHRAMEQEVGFFAPVYDVNALKNAGAKGFKPGEQVQVTEKIHGSNARFVSVDGVFYVGSHEQWKVKGNNWWWNATVEYPEIEEWCHQNPGCVLYGEVGPSQKGFHYGSEGRPFFYAFDVWVPEGAAITPDGNPSTEPAHWEWPGNMGFAATVPVLYVGPYDKDVVAKFVDGETVTYANTLEKKHIREGIVVRSLETGRKLKWVSNEYLK